LYNFADGTTNFAHGYPSFAVSVGVLYRGKPTAAAVVIFSYLLLLFLVV
jgi:fructose-1,6-bisphosphatase/inositol monophosphatase family enzyme